jgi:predicted nucleic acid-binding protein
MSFLLDTDICSAHIRRPAGLAHRFFQHAGRLWISAVTLAELHAGAQMVGSSRILTSIRDLRTDVGLLDFNEPCAEEFGRLRGVLHRSGLAVNPPDLMIAATALVHSFTLVTHNTAHFQNIPGLRLEDWLLP